MSRSTLFRIAVVVLLLAGVLAALNVFVEVDRDDLERAIDQAGLLGPAAYALILLTGLTVPFNPVSDLLTVTVASILLDPVEAIIATFVAHSSAITVNYLVARRFGAGILNRVAEERRFPLLARAKHQLNLRTVFLLRLALPLTAVGIDVVGYLAGAQRLRFPGYFVASIVPWTVFNVIYFTSAGALRDISPALVLLPAVLLIAGSSLLVYLLRRAERSAGVPESEDSADRAAEVDRS